MVKWYGQFGEDIAIYPILKDIEKGYFVDVGALDGVHASNTLLFEKLGWGGVAIEPHSGFFKRLDTNRQCITLNYAVWSENLDSVEFHETAPGEVDAQPDRGSVGDRRVDHRHDTNRDDTR